MGQLDNHPENSGDEPNQATEALLRKVTQDLENLQRNLLVQLNQDVERLQAEKARLAQEIDDLQVQRQQEQVAQQQQLLKQLAQGLATQLQEHFTEQLDQVANAQKAAIVAGNGGATELNENAYRLLASLDATLRTTFKTLQQDLSSYQSSLSQQLSNMHSLEQQGEVILDSLVNRLKGQLKGSGAALPLLEPSAGQDRKDSQKAKPIPLTPAAEPPKPRSQAQLGLIFVMLSTIALSVHNVVVRIIASDSKIFGTFPIKGVIQLVLGNSLLILWLRMIVVIPMMAVLAGYLYPNVWKEIKKFFTSQDRSPVTSFFKAVNSSVVGSGFFLFLSQVLIYIAIAQIGPGVAVTILFMYPILTVPLAWLMFGDKPTLLRWGVMAIVLLGVLLVALPNIVGSAGNISVLGVGTAVASGVAFAFYLIFMQLGFKRLHPVPVSLIQFSTIFVLTSLSLMWPLPANLSAHVIASNWPGLLTGALVLGILTLLGYLLNNFAVRYMGAAQASIIASSGPTMTAILAFLIVPSPVTALKPLQIAGIVLVTAGVGALSFEKLLIQKQPVPATK